MCLVNFAGISKNKFFEFLIMTKQIEKTRISHNHRNIRGDDVQVIENGMSTVVSTFQSQNELPHSPPSFRLYSSIGRVAFLNFIARPLPVIIRPVMNEQVDMSGPPLKMNCIHTCTLTEQSTSCECVRV